MYKCWHKNIPMIELRGSAWFFFFLWTKRKSKFHTIHWMIFISMLAVVNVCLPFSTWDVQQQNCLALVNVAERSFPYRIPDIYCCHLMPYCLSIVDLLIKQILFAWKWNCAFIFIGSLFDLRRNWVATLDNNRWVRWSVCKRCQQRIVG